MRCYRVLTVGGKPPAGRASGGNPGSSLTCTSVFSVPSSCMVLVVVSTRFNSRPSGPTYRYVLTVLDVRVILRNRYLSINKLLKIKFEHTYWQFSWYWLFKACTLQLWHSQNCAAWQRVLPRRHNPKQQSLTCRAKEPIHFRGNPCPPPCSAYYSMQSIGRNIVLWTAHNLHNMTHYYPIHGII